MCGWCLVFCTSAAGYNSGSEESLPKLTTNLRCYYEGCVE